jgi:type IX secretion system PorP/SprF family membrane protein
MKKLYLQLLALCLAPALFGQQEQLYTQFVFNKLAFNPGYAGSFDSPTLIALHRSQWMGFEGAPSGQVVSYDQRILNNRVGLGGNISRSTVGINTNLTLDITYAYRIAFKRGTLSLGLQPSVRNLRQNWADPRIRALDKNDPSIPVEPGNKMLPNVGFGVFYTGYRWYAGVAVPRLVSNNIDFAEFGGELSREVPHMNAMGGFRFRMSKDVEFTPQVLLRYVFNAPFDADLNLSFMLRKKFYLGAGYRLGGDTNWAGESVDALVGLQATENLFLCMSYDIGLTRLRRYHNGSLEAAVRWWFNPPADVDEGSILSPL